MSPATNLRILLIDDMPSIHDDFRKLLCPAGGTDRAAAAALDEDEALLFGGPPATGAAPGPGSGSGSAGHPASAARPDLPDYDVDSALQGRQGWDMVRDAVAQGRPYAMAFVDMRMPPGWDGVETIEHLWQADPDLQVVICTAYTDHSWEDVMRRLDGRDRLLVLKKPFDPIEAVQAARALVQKWNLARQAEAQMQGLETAVQARTRELTDEVTARRHAELALRVRERAIEAAVNPIMITNGQLPGQPIEYVNPAFERVTGYPPAEVLGRNARFLQGEDHEQPGLSQIAQSVRDWSEGRAVLRNYRRDGRLFWNDLRIAPVRDSQGLLTHFVGVINDVTAEREAQEALQHQAGHDALTGLPNRLTLQDRLAVALTRARRLDERVGVLWLDLDHFKFINDSYGHAVGDALLQAMAARLRGAVRESDTVARLGGDEFVILLPGLRRAADAAVAAQKVLDALVEPVHVDGHVLQAGTSIGVAVYPEDGARAETLLTHADIAMYRAKQEGRNSWRFFSQEMSQAARAREDLAHALRSALAERQFELHWQPQLHLASGRLVGAEALLRWHHPTLGLVPPADFIPVAEETGLIADIGGWVLRNACAQMARWHRQGLQTLQLAVNVSPRQFRQHDLAATVREALAESGLPGRHLRLEFTERLLQQSGSAVLKALQSLKAQGLSLSLDDFGTGHSSLATLHQFPIDEVKIDLSLIRGVASSGTDAAIVRAILRMAQSLGLQVTAEGVETQAQLSFLKTEQCERAQGFLLGAPLDAASFTAQWVLPLRHAGPPLHPVDEAHNDLQAPANDPPDTHPGRVG